MRIMNMILSSLYKKRWVYCSNKVLIRSYRFSLVFIIFSFLFFSILSCQNEDSITEALEDAKNASIKPEIVSITATKNDQVQILFKHKIDLLSTLDTNFQISDENGTPLAISSVQTTEKTVVLSSASQKDQVYSVQISGVKSANTVKMEPYLGSFSGDGLPFVVNITSNSNNGAIYPGQEILIQVEFSEPVEVTGVPTLLMNTGIIGSTAVYVSGSGTNILTFSYIVGSGESSSNLDASSLSLNGGSIKDFNQNVNPNLSLPAPGEIGSLSYNNSFTVNSTEFSVSDVTVNEGDGSATITISKTGNSPGSVSVDYATSDNTATNNATVSVDYTVASGTLVWAIDDETSGKTFSITIINDFTIETDETFTVTLSNPVNATIINSTATVTIIEDKTAPTFAGVSSAIAVNSDKIDLSWTAATDNFSSPANIKYEICQNTISGTCGTSFTATYTTSLGATGYNVTGLSVATPYYFVVRAVDQSGNQDANTTEMSATTTAIRGPLIQSTEYYDTDQNGRLDHVKLTFDETLDDSTFDGYNLVGTPNDQVHNVTTVWDIAGRVKIKMDTRDIINTVTGDNVTDDNVIWLAFDEIGSGYDTGASPNLTANNSALRDLDTGNCYIQTDNANCSIQASADIITTDVIETDLAPPIIVNASGITTSAVLSVTFSEPVDSTSGGGCSDALVPADFAYSGTTTINSMGTDTNGCDDNIVEIILNIDLPAGDINSATIAAANDTAIYDAADNPMPTATATTTITETGAIAPYVLDVVSTSTTTILVTFSEAVDNTQAMDYANYTLIEDPADSGCVDIGKDTGTAIVKISDSQYELSNTDSQCATTTYKLTASTNIIDLNEGIALASPNFGNFLGAETLKMVNAYCIDTLNIKVVFNKDVLSGTANGADVTTNYKITGVSDLGVISSAVISPNNEVTLTHPTAQNGGIYTVIGANQIDGDGFDDGINSIRVSTTEWLQASPNDRASFTGCGAEVINFSDGPISSDPFGDGITSFGYVNTYNNKIFIGPNTNSNGVNRFEPAGTNPVNVDFSFTRDTTGTRVSTNTAGLPYYSIGHTGCTANSNDKDLGCGPDNEDGRGLFAGGIISGAEYLFITGARSTGDNDYLYWTTVTDTTLNFNYVDLSDTFDNGDDVPIANNKGTESIAIMNDKIYWMLPGNGSYQPYFIKINHLTTESSNNTDSVNMKFRYMTGIGRYSTLKPNMADNIGGTLFVFNNILYVGNSGSVRDISNSDYDCPVGSTSSSATACNNDGGIVRSNNNDPGACTATDTCEFTDITPTASEFVSYFSILLPKLADLTPAMRPVPAFADFNGNLYMIRNACTTNMIDFSLVDATTCTGAFGSEVPQLWKCDPTNGGADVTDPTTCESGEWVLIDGISAVTDELTNFGDASNTKITLLITNGAYLYVGFDNSSATGIEIWRTKIGMTNPTDEDDFEQIGGDGLGDANNQEIYSAASVQDGVDYYIYVSTGQSVVPVSVYRQKNN